MQCHPKERVAFAPTGKSETVPKSILDAIKLGLWDYEPSDVPTDIYDPTEAMPGTREKVDVMADRIRDGLPLWHPRDRDDLEAPPPVCKPR
jgi:hypothetical protein